LLQHGFRKGYSCASNLLVFLESVTASIDAKQNVDTTYLDLAKAFNKVPHNRLIQKLKAHGIDGLICIIGLGLVRGLHTKFNGNEYVWMALTPAGNEFGAEFPRVQSWVQFCL